MSMMGKRNRNLEIFIHVVDRWDVLIRFSDSEVINLPIVFFSYILKHFLVGHLLLGMMSSIGQMKHSVIHKDIITLGRNREDVIRMDHRVGQDGESIYSDSPFCWRAEPADKRGRIKSSFFIILKVQFVRTLFHAPHSPYHSKRIIDIPDYLLFFHMKYFLHKSFSLPVGLNPAPFYIYNIIAYHHGWIRECWRIQGSPFSVPQLPMRL